MHYSLGITAIGDDMALTRSISETALGAWRTKAEALPQQFRNAAVAAAKLLELKTQSVRLTSGTLKAPVDAPPCGRSSV